MDWIHLENEQQLQGIVAGERPTLIFKHSTRCAVSSMAKRNIALDADAIPANVDAYYLDLIRYRTLSNEVARIWEVRHESPQVLLVQGSTCLYHASHGEIDIPTAVAALPRA